MPLKDSHITDNELLERFYSSHDNKWLGILLPRYTLLLFGVCMKYLKNEEDSKDAVQQVFLKVISELHKYKVDYFKSWLYMIAKNYCLMKLRNNGTHAEINERVMGTPDESSGKESLIEKDRDLHLMSMAMEQLNNEQRRCIELFYLQKKSYAEVADETGYTMLQVKSNIQNGKRNLKLLMEQLIKQKNER
jgi:RNA polymerase sigma factor (sigma-70 family)